MKRFLDYGKIIVQHKNYKIYMLVGDCMKKCFKKNWWYSIVFIIVFIFLNYLGFNHNYGDPIANYGFAYAISIGQIPYVDFNTISTSLYAFYTSLGLNIINNYVVFLLEQTLLVTVTFYLLYQMFGKKSLVMLLVTVLFQYCNIIGTYNYMCFFIMILLLYLEKNYSNKDYLIGIILALGVLSKQTVGCFMLIPSIIFYHKDLKKLLRRFIGFLIPCSIFLIYLLCNGALYEFFNMCLFGLFDFAFNNGVGGGKINDFWLTETLVCLIISIFVILKNKKVISNYYLFWGIFFAIPLFDMTHFAMYFNCIAIMLLPYIKLNDKAVTALTFAISVPIAISCFYFWTTKDLVVTSKINNFGFNIHIKSSYINDNKYVEYINSFEKPIVIGYFAMKYDLISERELSYFDVPMYGNFGYNGTQRMIDMIEDMHDQIFVVSIADYEQNYEYSQFVKEMAGYVINNCEKIDEKYEFIVYYKK